MVVSANRVVQSVQTEYFVHKHFSEIKEKLESIQVAIAHSLTTFAHEKLILSLQKPREMYMAIVINCSLN